MEINEYQKLAMVTLNNKLDKKEILTNSVMGLCGESGGKFYQNNIKIFKYI